MEKGYDQKPSSTKIGGIDLKKKGSIHRHAHRTAIRRAWSFMVKRKLLAGLSAGLLAVVGLAAGDAYIGVKHYIALHESNAVAVPRLNQEMLDVRNQLTALDNYTNADYWRWRRQTNWNAQVQQQLDRMRSKKAVDN